MAIPFIENEYSTFFEPRSGGTVPPLRGSCFNFTIDFYKRSRHYVALNNRRQQRLTPDSHDSCESGVKSNLFHAKLSSCHVVAKRRQPHNIVYFEMRRKTMKSEVAWVVWLSSLRYDMTTHLMGRSFKSYFCS